MSNENANLEQRAVHLIMENGSTTTWIGWAEDTSHAEGLAISWAEEMFSGMQVYGSQLMPDSYFQ